MAVTHVVNVDLVKVYRQVAGKLRYFTTLAWGDPVEVLGASRGLVRLAAPTTRRQPDGGVRSSRSTGVVKLPRGGRVEDLFIPRDESRVLKVDFVDVQQGDAAVVETPAGRTILIDGGDNQLFARYLAARYRDTSARAPKDVDCILVTHGDADHFLGLTEIHASETHDMAYKRLFIRPRRVYHNGLVKRPSKLDGQAVPDAKQLGRARKVGGDLIVTQLEENLLDVADADMNEPFRRWKGALRAYQQRTAIVFRRLERGDKEAFEFLAGEGIGVEVLGPTLTEAGRVRGLKFLGAPTERFGRQPGAPARFSGRSASHTINGHSVILRLAYGNARLLFAGDLNEEAALDLVTAHRNGDLDLRSEVLKVPHHGSGDFSAEFLEAVAPVASVVSSGDESARKEYIHPRATLITALGRFARPEADDPVVFVTELVAFFQQEGWVTPPKGKQPFFAFSRAAFGIVKVRTDGDRLLVWTNSGSTALKECYAYDLTSPACPRVALRRA